MIIRKPYAFLIKNFKKIHIFLLLLSLFVAYKLLNVSSFVSEFMNLGVYDFYNDPITNYISFFLMLSVVLLFVGSAALILLLRYKKKPWKVYLIPFFEYLALFFVLGMIKGFFNKYSYDVETTDLRLSRDLLFMFIMAQLPAIGIYAMRVFGLDISKFNFNSDKEFLELSEADREEIEISLNIDKDTFKRGYKRFIRNVKYVYLEHKKICISIFIVLFIFCGFRVYKLFFVTNKSYLEGELYNANGYSITINKSYFTNKDYAGNVITDKSNFLILDLTVKNNSSPRVVNVNNFHLKNGNKDFITTRTTYQKEFEDFGLTYDNVKELKRDETLQMIIVYKVDKELKKDRFVLYYQEEGNEGLLRKIKLNVEDVSMMQDVKELELGDNMDVNIYKGHESISIDSYEIGERFTYTTRKCTTLGCVNGEGNYSVDANNKIIKLHFASEAWEPKNMIDFLTKYGKIIYKDSSGKTRTLRYENPIKNDYFGKVIFIRVPKEVEMSESVVLSFTIRNKNYSYRLV